MISMMRKKEQGFVAIFSVLIIMALLSLVVIGFSKATRTAQREALDEQLNNQAFYAAESGVNDARAFIKANPGAFEKNDCQTGGGGVFGGYNTGIDEDLQTGYSCVLVTGNVTELNYEVATVGKGSPKIAPIIPGNNENVASLTVSWKALVDTYRVGGRSTMLDDYPNVLPSAPAWGDDKVGMVRIDIVPTNALDSASMAEKSYTVFLYPVRDNSGKGTKNININRGYDGQGRLALIKCETDNKTCNATISLNGSDSNSYMMRIQAIYNEANVTVKNLTTSSGASGQVFKNAQALVDVTGRANYVYKRIQVRLPLEGNGRVPDFALFSADTLCKRLKTATGSLIVDSNGVAPRDSDACALD